MADDRLRELEREAQTDIQAARRWTLELKRLSLAYDECDACWGKGWIERVVHWGVVRSMCGDCAVGKPRPRPETKHIADERGRGPGPMSHWREQARAVIWNVMQANSGAPRGVLEKLVRAAYPFGQRAYHPYKVWLDEVRKTFPKAGGERGDLFGANLR